MRRPFLAATAASVLTLAPALSRAGGQAVTRAFDAPSTRLAILAAEDRRAPTPRDVATLVSGARSRDPQTARIAVRALGRLERPALIPDIVPALRSPVPEIRAEAANAIAQAAQGLRHEPPARSAAVHRTAAASRAAASPLDGAIDVLVARLAVEDDSSVVASLDDSLGRLPFASAAQAESAARALLASLDRDASINGRLGVAAGLDALARQPVFQAPAAAIEALKALVEVRPNEAATAARVRRLALDALITAKAVDAATLAHAALDSDPQVRRLAARGAADPAIDAPFLPRALADDAAMVRFEALRTMAARRDPDACAQSLAAVEDRDVHVALLALDQLGGCGRTPDAVDRLVRTVNDLSQAGSPRGWHRAAHAMVALASAASDRAGAALPQLFESTNPHLRTYAARAAATLGDRRALERLAADADDNVREAAIDGLSKVAGHAADATYIAALARGGYQVLRAAAVALDGTTARDGAASALAAALDRLNAEGRDNSHDARAAIAHALTGLGVPPKRIIEPKLTPAPLTVEDLRRLAAPRARVTVRDVGSFDLALVTSEAPATVLTFARFAESGYYNGLTIHRVVPDFVVQGGSPGANEYIGQPSFMRDEVGLWPHVRGAVGISTRGRDTGDAQFFIDLVDNPRLDHEYTVFGQVLAGMDVVDRILEGDVIERVEILVN